MPGSSVAGGANKADDGGKKKKANEGTEEDDDLTALIKGIVFADPLSTLKKATREAVSKFKALGRNPPSAAAVKTVWLKLGLDKQDDDALIHKFWTIGVNPDAKSVATEYDKASGVQGSDEIKDDGVWFPVRGDPEPQRCPPHCFQTCPNVFITTLPTVCIASHPLHEAPAEVTRHPNFRPSPG